MMRRATPDILGDVLSAEPGENRLEIRRQLRWDYGQVAPEHRKAVEDAAVDIAVAGRRMASNVVQIGQRLNEVKKLLEHGLFTDWCEVEFGTAQRWMSVAETLGDKSDKLSHLGSSVLYLLAADSTPEAVREAVIEEAASTGRAPAVAEVRQAIRLFVENLRGIVRLWVEEQWLRSGREIPPNPAHTNGIFWQELTTWMHANISDRWTEADLKAAIRHECSREQRTIDAAEAPIAKGTYASGLPTLELPEPGASVVPSDAAHSRQRGAVLGKCRICNRPLTDPAQAAAGVGACCAAKQAATSSASDAEKTLEEHLLHVVGLHDPVVQERILKSAMQNGSLPAQVWDALACYTDVAAVTPENIRYAARAAYMRVLRGRSESAAADDEAPIAEDLTWNLAPWLRDAGWKQFRLDSTIVAIHPVHGMLSAKRGEIIAMHRQMAVLVNGASEGDERRARLGQYLTQFEATLNALPAWAEMTGRFTATGEAERGLRRLIDLTRQEMAALSGAEGGLDDAAL